jgi:lipopolysaccharide biosynthesis regulator YciM
MLSIGEKLRRALGFPDIATMTALQIDSAEKLKQYKRYSVEKINSMIDHTINYKECEKCCFCTYTTSTTCPNCKQT